MLRSTALCLLVVAMLTTALGCQAGRYDGRFVYQPRPITVDSPQPGAPEAGSLRTLVTVLGVRRADRSTEEANGLPTSVHVRLRIDNNTGAVATLDPETISLFAADLAEFPQPVLRPDHVLMLEPDTSGTVDAFFPLPGGRIPGDMDITGLGLRWTALLDDQPVPGTATFTRREPRPRYHGDSGPRFNVGFGYHHHRRR